MKSSKKTESAFDKDPQVEAVQEESTKDKVVKKSIARKTVLMWTVVVLLVIAGAGSGVYYYIQYQTSQKILKDPVLGTRIEAEKTVEKVAKMVELPQEQPTIATVSDVSKLKGQPFFANAQNGDKVLIYQNAKKAILYRPGTNKIVEFGPINLGAQNATPSANVTLKPVRVALYNGTTTVGLANAVELDLKGKAAHVTVVTKGNAVKRNYEKTLVVDVNGANKAEADNLAKLVNGSVGTLPAGEKASSSAEILIILGRP
jgi:hypothetical protein